MNVYISSFGAFEIPPRFNFLEMEDSNKPSLLDHIFFIKREPILEIAKFPKNLEFWEWLDQKEKDAGKKVIPSYVWEEASKIGLTPRNQVPEILALRFHEIDNRLDALDRRDLETFSEYPKGLTWHSIK